MWCSALKIETGRFQNIPIEYRICTMCDQNVIETESNFLLCCSKYNQLRYDFMAGLTGLFDRYLNFDVQ